MNVIYHNYMINQPCCLYPECQSKYFAIVAKLGQKHGISVVETESRNKILFFIADEGRSAIVKSSSCMSSRVNCFVLSV